jgi:hypothetical protein
MSLKRGSTLFLQLPHKLYGVSLPHKPKLYLLKGHILMAKRLAGRVHILRSKVCILLQDTRTDISLHKHIYDSFVILLIYDL